MGITVSNLDGFAAYLDDIIIVGSSREELLSRELLLESVNC